MMETYISFYLKANRIHVFVDALREIGSPKRICFMISDDGKKLLVVPYQKQDFVSHKVPSEVYKGVGGMEVSSLKLCALIAKMYNWDTDRSYRVPGIVYSQKHIAVFELTAAEVINREYLRRHHFQEKRF